MTRNPVVLVILDGLGVATPNKGNAVTLAKTPNLDVLWPKYPHTYLEAAGNFVGLPKGVVGNSEVGHMSLGAGLVMFQEIARIDNEIETGKFYQNKTFNAAIDHIKKTGGKIHLMGLVSPGKVHASPEHLYACMEFCKRANIPAEKVIIHVFTDGRDSEPKSAIEHVSALAAKCKYIGVGKIATLIGRYLAMDRDERWDRTKKAYELIVNSQGKQYESWEKAIDDNYANDVTDEFLEPCVITENGEPVGKIQSGDSVVFTNYRADRAVQLSKPFADQNFKEWDVSALNDIYFAGFSNYQKGMVMNRAQEDIESFGNESKMVEELFDAELKNKDSRFPKNQIFPPEKAENPLGKIIADAGMAQLRIAESEKYPHVTYFFNVREQNPFEREERIEIPSPKDVATYDLKPEMSSYELTDMLISNLDKDIFDFVLVNFANTDMVAHTGNLQASISAVQHADTCVGRIYKKVMEKNGTMMITSDHGNVEELLNLTTNEVDTQHSLNQVPFMYISSQFENDSRELPIGMLADIAPTVLNSLGINSPPDMSGRCLIS